MGPASWSLLQEFGVGTAVDHHQARATRTLGEVWAAPLILCHGKALAKESAAHCVGPGLTRLSPSCLQVWL